MTITTDQLSSTKGQFKDQATLKTILVQETEGIALIMKDNPPKKSIGSPNNFVAIFKDQQETENDMKIIEKRQLDLNDYNIIDSKKDLESNSMLKKI